MKPVLNSKNKLKRLQWCLKFIGPANNKFESMYNYAHLREKWFYLAKTTENHLMRENGISTTRQGKSPRSITKVMLLVATPRPRFDEENDVLFNRKIRCWTIFQQEAAKRSSVNRSKDTLELKSLNVNRKMYKNILIDDVIPAIDSKWPDRIPWNIRMQHDNAAANVPTDDKEMIGAGYRRKEQQLLWMRSHRTVQILIS